MLNQTNILPWFVTFIISCLGLVLDKLKMCHFFFNHFSLILIRSTSTPLLKKSSIATSPRITFIHVQIIQVLFLTFFLNQSHSYIALDVFIPDLISHSMCTHLFHHSHLRNFHLLNVRIFYLLTVYYIQHSWSNHYSIEFVFKFLWPFLPHKCSYVNLHFIHSASIPCVTSLSTSPIP